MRMSGNSFSNISGAFAGASSALGQAAQIKAQQQLEEMRDLRAENLARMQFGWKAQHDVNLQERSFQHDTRIEQMRDELQGKQILSQQDLQQRGGEAYMDRIRAMQEGEQRRQEGREDAADRRQRQGLIAQNRLEMQRGVEDHDRQITQAQQEIARAVQGRPDLSMIDDPVKKRAAMASDPVIGPMLDQLNSLQKSRTSTVTAHTLYGAQLGDPMFQGKQTAELDQSNPGGPPKLIQDGYVPNDGGGARTPNNPNAPTVPGYPTNPEADNTPAVGASPPGSQPGSSAAGMPPTLGLQRPPQSSMVGPLNQPQIVPMNGSQFSSIGSPMGAAPSIIAGT